MITRAEQVKTLLWQTVPLDRTGTQPRPRQAKAMVNSCLLSLLLSSFLSFSVAPPFLLQTPCHLSLNSTTLFTPEDLSIHIPVQAQHPDKQHLQTQTLPLHLLTHPPAVPDLSSLQLTQHVTENKYFFSVHTMCGCFTLVSPPAKLHSQGATYASPQTQTLLSPVSVVSTSHPHPAVSNGRILPGHGLSLTVISLWCSNMWRGGFSHKVLMY